MVLAGKLKDGLHLLQYPLRPSYRSYGDQGDMLKFELGSQLYQHNPTPKAN